MVFSYEFIVTTASRCDLYQSVPQETPYEKKRNEGPGVSKDQKTVRQTSGKGKKRP